MTNKYIFTFWEPEDKLPAYLELCMQTWKKYLPDYEIISLNFNNLDKYLPKDIIEKIVYKKISLPQQADCIRAWLLYMYGGYWFDNDTIFTDDKIVREMQNHECCMMGNQDNKNGVNIGFIYAKKGSSIIKQWAEEIPNRVANYKNYRRFKLFYQLFNRKEHKLRKSWSYFGNNIIDSLIKCSTNEDFYILDKNNLYTLLEEEIKDENNYVKKYQQFYFENYDYKKALAKNKGVIYLHNSWTPKKYKRMTQEEFLNTSVSLAKLLKEILEI